MSNDRNVRFTQTSIFFQRRRVVVKEIEERNLRIGDLCQYQSLHDDEVRKVKIT
jgi:hypothetical protein